jgi:hypothetical protein
MQLPPVDCHKHGWLGRRVSGRRACEDCATGDVVITIYEHVCAADHVRPPLPRRNINSSRQVLSQRPLCIYVLAPIEERVDAISQVHARI